MAFSCNSNAVRQEEVGQATSEQDEKKIVTLGGTITEIVCALGACSSIVATDMTSTYPPEVKDLQTLGYRGGIKAEGIIAQEAEIVIAEEDYMKPEVYTQLESAGIPFKTIANKSTLQSSLNMIRELGTLLGKEPQAHILEQKIQQDMEKVDSLLT